MSELEAKQQEIEKLKSELKKYQNQTTNPSDEQNSKTNRQEKLFLVMFITFLASIPTILVLRYIENRVEQVIYLTVGLLLLVFITSFFIIKYKERILTFLFSTAKTQVDEVLAPVPKVIQAYQQKDVDTLQKEALEIFKMAYAKYSWLKMRGFIISSTMALFVGFGGLLGVFMIFKQNDLIENQNKLLTSQTKQAEAQTQLAEATRRSSLVFLMSNIMDKVDEEIRNDTLYPYSLKLPQILFDSLWSLPAKKVDSLVRLIPKKQLSTQLEGRIVALSRSLKPYKYIEGDSLILKPLSPERAQLLVSLIASKVHLKYLYAQCTFAYADLKNASLPLANLRKINLADANLSQADLRRAILKGAFLKNTNLTETNLGGAYLREAYLSHANLTRVNLHKADLTKAVLTKSNLKKANLTRADLGGSYLIGVDLRGADLEGASFNNAELINANLQRLDLTKVDLRGTDLREADLREARLPNIPQFQTIHINKRTKLQNAFVDNLNWLKNLQKQKKDLQVYLDQYQVVKLDLHKKVILI
ncbi:hypothetical protein BKI52_12135 [marine bacterium AO1-C]|nr:hypothetical protein BKI52_12135 [marine bacterium AO1-C]